MNAVVPPSSLRKHVPSVLIVEDERRLRELLGDVVRQMGFPTRVARSAEEALGLIESEPADIVMLDLMLPGESGLDFLDRLRGMGGTGGVGGARGGDAQVIIMTAYGSLESAQRAIRAGISDFLTKPTPLGEIEAALDRARRRWTAQAHLPAKEIFGEEEREEPSKAPLPLSEVERQQIMAALVRHRGNRTAAAQELGISRRTLHYRLAEYRAAGFEID